MLRRDNNHDAECRRGSYRLCHARFRLCLRVMPYMNTLIRLRRGSATPVYNCIDHTVRALHSHPRPWEQAKRVQVCVMVREEGWRRRKKKKESFEKLKKLPHDTVDRKSLTGLLAVEKQIHAVSLIKPSDRYLDVVTQPRESLLCVSAFRPIHRSLKYKQTYSNIQAEQGV